MGQSHVQGLLAEKKEVVMKFIAITIACVLIGGAIGSCVGIAHKTLENAGVVAVNRMLSQNFWR
jgi:hypothetical protein